tara:strand:- start:348 stop:530 length:183 start_codon:yes stop_codon:yes gene_type:complete
MNEYIITAEKTRDNGQTWETWRLEVIGYHAALRVAKALDAANTGFVLLRNKKTGRARLID